MPDRNELFRKLPKVDELMDSISGNFSDIPAAVLKESVHEVLDGLRAGIKTGEVTGIPDFNTIGSMAADKVRKNSLPTLRPVINGSGIVIHTNLGRSCLSEGAVKAVVGVAGGYSTLEYDVEKGTRGSRHVHIEDLICSVTGAEAAMVVNNNAGAVLLILSELGKGGEVITSRGELVEIGGSFRIPEIMEACGCTLKEVGATNKTHVSDYENAINPDTKALLKVHTSNYRIVGFSEEVSLSEMMALGAKYGLPVIQDLGSGCLVDLHQFGIHDEPCVQESIKAGVDLISISGDKLLGGAQAGIILGKKEYIEKLKKHPLARALRVDKMTLAALRETLFVYQDENRAKVEIPTLAMIGAKPEYLKFKAENMAGKLNEAGFKASVTELEDQVGGGSVPNQMLQGYGVIIDPGKYSVDQLEEKLRLRVLPIIGRINRDRYMLSVRTLLKNDEDLIIQALKEIF